MRLLLPIFLRDTTMINSHVGVYEQEGLVHYLVSGLPVYSYLKAENEKRMVD